MKTSLAILTVGLLSVVAAPAYADSFVIAPEDGDELKMFNDVANKDVTSFEGCVGSNNGCDFLNNTGPIINITTSGSVTTGSGYANIKPSKDTLLTTLTYTPLDNSLFDGMFFRAQMEIPKDVTFDGKIFLTVTDESNLVTNLVFTVLVDNSKDFPTIGFEPCIEPCTENHTIKSVVISLTPDSPWSFKEVKQNDFSSGSIAPVPLPAALPLFAGGLGLMGWMARRRRSQAAHA